MVFHTFRKNVMIDMDVSFILLQSSNEATKYVLHWFQDRVNSIDIKHCIL